MNGNILNALFINPNDMEEHLFIFKLIYFVVLILLSILKSLSTKTHQNIEELSE